MMANSVYSCDQPDGSYVIGTVSNGVLFWPPKERLNIIFQNKGLSNNTVLSLFEDADKNLWTG
jgi:ligand-binding sensor domain-containing protein